MTQRRGGHHPRSVSEQVTPVGHQGSVLLETPGGSANYSPQATPANCFCKQTHGGSRTARPMHSGAVYGHIVAPTELNIGHRDSVALKT